MKPGVVLKRNVDGRLVLERKMLGVHQVLSMTSELCVGCGICAASCPEEASRLSSVAMKDGRLTKKALVDLDAYKCIFCGGCVVLCPANAIQIEINGKQTVPLVEANVFPTLMKEIDVDVEKCEKACNLVCQESCPTKSIEVIVKRTENGEILRIQDVKVDKKLCIFCKRCESLCPYNAIHVTKPFYGSLRLNTNSCPEGCQVCIDACPSKAISLNEDKKPSSTEEFCIYCGACQEACPERAIFLERTQILHTEVTSGAWITALEKLTSRPYLVKELTSRARKKLHEVTQNIGRF